MPKGGDNTARRKWDAEEFAERARERQEAEKAEARGEGEGLTAKQKRLREKDPLHMGLITERAALKQRDTRIDLSSRVGTVQIISANAGRAQQYGFWCAVCEVGMQDSQSYLDHVNGKQHHRLLGMSMRTERSNKEQVKNKFQELKRKRDQPKLSAGDEYEARLSRMQEEEEALKEARKQRKLAKKQEAEAAKQKELEAAEEGMDPEMMAMMGFSGFK